MKRKIGIREVAEIAGVSISTVSRVLNGSAPVSDELKRKVLEAVEKLGYKPNSIAQGLRKGVTRTIGFIVPDITNPFFPGMVKGAEDYLRRKGYALMLCNSDQKMDEESRLLDVLMSKKVDGLIFTGSGKYNPKIEEVIKSGMKVVLLDRIYEALNTYYVIADNESGMRELLQYLIKTGHRSFALLNGNKDTYSAQERYRVFKEVMGEYGIENFQVIFGKFTYESGARMAKKLKKLPDAIVCGNDLIAFGVIDALEEMGYSVPEDVSVTGFDDIQFSRHYKPPLTTVRQPVYELGKRAAQLLLEVITGRHKKKRGVILKTELVIRQSTAPRGGRR